ncbi:hypothetical protein [Massilia agri]|uniref:PEGA domain-containing protein n=1 Tax=Massilia agri TaxID=1886785 RepID=A0ABT2APQ0_9BURK|nr:hypothetical protein [Massilia agri]MCS0598227.1 hypothetical protein [Massilia agri]
MMTSTPVTQQQQTDGRTVREVVECNQELVNEVWCRRIFRQILQSLELQYAMQMPHRPIDPDTVLVLDSGDPILLPSPESDAPWSEAGDMHDLAAVVHYAITMEAPPRAPLRGRVTGEYSDTFLAAVDRCLSPDPAERPRTIEELRNLLGIVPLGPALPVQPAPAALSPVQEAPPSFLAESSAALDKGRLRRWLMLVAAATVLLCAAGALIALLHQADSRDALTLSLPDEPLPQAPADAQALPAGAELAVAGAALPAGQPQPDPLAAVLPPANAPAMTPHGAAQPAMPAGAGASYKLIIKPWGMVQVNGVNYGASPPLKRLNLAPGEHTIRITNPSFPEHTVTVNAAKGDSSTIELDFSEEATQ